MNPIRLLRLVFAATAALLPWMESGAQGAGEQGVWDLPRTGGESITEPSPEATAMRRYQDYPISYATGTADISVPLLRLPGGAVAVELGLSYHTGGIRKDDIPTGVGLGWTLTGLGSVSRQINGLPDEWRGPSGTSVTHDVRRNPDVDYLRSILSAAVDAEYDIYSYCIPGYSGSFYIDSAGKIVSLPASEVEIVAENERLDGSGEIARFEIHTPDGAVFTFEDKEYIETRNMAPSASQSIVNRDYTAISQWNLTGISSSLSDDTVVITYSKRSEWSRVSDKMMSSYSLSTSTAGGISGGSSAATPTLDDRTTFRSHSIPKTITTRSGSIEFTSWKAGNATSCTAPADYIATLRLKDAQHNVVKVVTLDNAGQFRDGRRKLDGVTVTQDGIVTDSYRFSYNNLLSDDGADLFGYPNGRGLLAGYHHSVLDEYLNLSSFRLSDSEYIADNCLTSILDISGVRTDIDYEPAVISVSPLYSDGVFSGAVTVGVRIHSIEASDTVTGRIRRREFSYADPLCSVPLEELKKGDFISQSGRHVYYNSGGVTPSTYTLNSTFTTSATLRGVPMESAVIYYGKVTETVTGTALTYPIETDYEYDLSRVKSQLMAVGSRPPYLMPSFGHNPGDAKSLTAFSGSASLHNDTERYLALYHPSRGYLSRVYGASPLLRRRVEKERIAGGGSRVNSIEESFYSTADAMTFTAAVCCESCVFRYDAVNGVSPDPLNVSSFDDVNYFFQQVSALRTVLDSTVVTRYYPDAKSRSVHTRYVNSSSDGYFPGIPADSLHVPAGIAYRPLGRIVSCGSESIATYTACTENVGTEYYADLSMRGLRYLPVVEKWIVTTTGGSDSLLRQTVYTPVGSHYFPRPSQVRVETAESLFGSRSLISCQLYTAYDFRGRIEEMTDAAGRRIRACWNDVYDQLASMSLMTGASDSLTTLYTHQPLVGCTSITAPSGRRRQFSYSGGRLASESNTASETVATYTYHLRGEDPGDPGSANRFTATLHDDAGEASQSVDYDGFGLPVVTVADVAGGGRTASLTDYDALDRPIRQWLPVPVAGSETPTAADVTSHYGDQYPYRSTAYRALRSDAPLSVIAEGELMQTHPSTAEYLCNTTSGSDLSLRCRHYRLGTSATSESVTLDGYYPAGALDVTRSTDPDGHRVLTFTDWRGFRILERRVLDATTFADTYWLYDPMGRVRVILQPMAADAMTVTGTTWTNTSAPLRDYAFISRYDRRGHCIYTLTPGGGPVRLAYDPLGRLAFRVTEDLLDDDELCEFFLYDAIGRPVVSGLCSNVFPYNGSSFSVPEMTASRTASEGTEIASSGYFVASGVAAKLSGAKATQISYYDDYSCLSQAGFEPLRSKAATFDATHAKGMLTATRTAVYQGIQGSYTTHTGSNALHAVFGYDAEGRITQQVETTILAGTTVTTDNSYTRQGRLLNSTVAIATPDSTYTLSVASTYDSTGAPTAQTATMRSGLWIPAPTPIAPSSSVAYTYTALGQPATVSYGADNTASYDYNLRGQVRQIATKGFTQRLWYEDGGATPCYNGNISRMQVGGVTADYTYDGLNRLTACASSDGYNTSYKYTLNSSPVAIERSGMLSDYWSTGLVDDLSLTYSGNRLTGVSDAADAVILEQSLDFPKSSATMDYDSEGRLCKDTGRGIERITYAPNDMPMGIFGEHGQIKTQYAYSADGRKLSVAYGHNYTSSITDTRYYVGPIEFVKRSGAGSKLAVERVNLPWGYFGDDGSAMVTLTDYQGNIRAVTRGSEVVDRIDYYPYGLPKASAPGSVTRYRYSGKELETRAGLDHYDFHARLQLPSVGLFSRPDPKAADYPGLNPYLFCAANPIIYTDPTGEDIRYLDENGVEYFYRVENGQIVVYDKDNNIVEYSKLSFIQSLIVEDLNKILECKIGIQTITELIDSENITTIRYGNEDSFDAVDNIVIYNPLAISYNLKCSLNFKTFTFQDISNTCQFLNLGHELFHAQDRLHGTLDGSIWYIAGNKQEIPMGELYACTKENQLRYQLGLPLRLTYSLRHNENGYCPDWKGFIPTVSKYLFKITLPNVIKSFFRSFFCF